MPWAGLPLPERIRAVLLEFGAARAASDARAAGLMLAAPELRARDPAGLDNELQLMIRSLVEILDSIRAVTTH